MEIGNADTPRLRHHLQGNACAVAKQRDVRRMNHRCIQRNDVPPKVVRVIIHNAELIDQGIRTLDRDIAKANDHRCRPVHAVLDQRNIIVHRRCKRFVGTPYSYRRRTHSARTRHNGCRVGRSVTHNANVRRCDQRRVRRFYTPHKVRSLVVVNIERIKQCIGIRDRGINKPLQYGCSKCLTLIGQLELIGIRPLRASGLARDGKV